MSRVPAAIAVAAVALGCASVEQNKTENLLTSAGFKMVASNTPEKIQALKTLPSGEISRVDRDGVIYYVYPDAEGCRCLRVGRQEQYDRYLKIVAERRAGRLETTGTSTQSGTFKGYDPW
jgi:hypothetical protein